MPLRKEKHPRPRLIPTMMVLLILEFPFLIFMGLNLLTNRWSFLTSWTLFWMQFQEAFSLFLKTPGEYVRDEILFFDVLLFAVLVVSGALALMAGLTLSYRRKMSWILGVLAQIGTLVVGLSLHFMHQTTQAYWLMAFGIMMVLHLNFGDIREWFVKPIDDLEEVVNV